MRQWLYARPGMGTALATGALSFAFALLLWFARLPVRDGAGATRTMRALDVWLALLDQLPPEAPGFLSRGPLTASLLVALVALAYVIVATLRLRDT